MLKTKKNTSDTIDIPPRIAKKFAWKDGVIVEARVAKGKLLILDKKKNKIAKIMQFAGIWEAVNTDRVFREIRKDWNKWQKGLFV
jgi:hypothetical protein